MDKRDKQVFVSEDKLIEEKKWKSEGDRDRTKEKSVWWIKGNFGQSFNMLNYFWIIKTSMWIIRGYKNDELYKW